MSGRLLDRRERIVAAGVEDDDARGARHRFQRLHQIGERKGVVRYIVFLLDAGIDRDQKVFAVDLQAVARIEHQRDVVGTLARHARCKVLDRLLHADPGQIHGEHDIEACAIEDLRDHLRIMRRVGQRRDRLVGRIADHQRHPVLGERRAEIAQ